MEDEETEIENPTVTLKHSSINFPRPERLSSLQRQVFLLDILGTYINVQMVVIARDNIKSVLLYNSSILPKNNIKTCENVNVDISIRYY